MLWKRGERLILSNLKGVDSHLTLIDDMAGVKDTVIIQEVRGSSGGERAEPQEKRDRNAAAGAQDEAAAEEAVVRDDAVRSTTTTQTDVQPAGNYVLTQGLKQINLRARTGNFSKSS